MRHRKTISVSPWFREACRETRLGEAVDYGREYGKGCLIKENGKWRAVIRYRDLDTGERNGAGKPVRGKWRTLSRTFDIPSAPGDGDMTGVKLAERALKQWRDEVLAAEDERQAQARMEREGYVPVQGVAELVAAYLVKVENESRPENSTMATYRRMERHIAGELGGVPIDGLTEDMVVRWLGNMNAQFAPETVIKSLRLLNASLEWAVDMGRIPTNPARKCRKPKQKRPEPNYLDMEQRARLMATLDEAPAAEPYALGVRIALMTGMREGEICALRWRDVDMNAGVIHVRHSIGRGDSTYEKTPKNGGSRRNIPMPESLVKAMRSRRASVIEERIAAGASGRDIDDLFVLGRPDGAYMNPQYLSRTWRRRYAAGLGLVGSQGRRPVFHDLRHTFATVAIAAGVDVKTVSSILGHANAAMTLNIYADADPEAKRRAADAVAAAMEGGATEPGQVVRFRPTGTGE